MTGTASGGGDSWLTWIMKGISAIIGFPQWANDAVSGSPEAIQKYATTMAGHAQTLGQVEQGFLAVKKALGEGTWQGSGGQAAQRLGQIIATNLAGTQTATAGVGQQAGQAGSQLKQLQTTVETLVLVANIIIMMGMANPKTLPKAIAKAKKTMATAQTAATTAQTGDFMKIVQSIMELASKAQSAQQTPMANPIGAGTTTANAASPYTPGAYGGSTGQTGNGYGYTPPNGFPYTGNPNGTTPTGTANGTGTTPPPGSQGSGWQPIHRPDPHPVHPHPHPHPDPDPDPTLVDPAILRGGVLPAPQLGPLPAASATR